MKDAIFSFVWFVSFKTSIYLKIDIINNDQHWNLFTSIISGLYTYNYAVSTFSTRFVHLYS